MTSTAAYLEVGAVRHVLEVSLERRQEAHVVLSFRVELGEILLEELERVVDVQVDVEQCFHFRHLQKTKVMYAHAWRNSVNVYQIMYVRQCTSHSVTLTLSCS